MVLAAVCAGTVICDAQADIIIATTPSQTTITAPSGHIQTDDLTTGGFAFTINSDNGAHGTITIDSTVTSTGSSAARIQAGAILAGFDVQGTLESDSNNAIIGSSSAAINTFTNSGTIRSRSTINAAIFLPGPVTTFTNTNQIIQTQARTGLVLDNVTTFTNSASGSITSAGAWAIRLGFASAAKINSFTNNGTITGGTIGIELGYIGGSMASITNSGTITGSTDSLEVRNGSELTFFDNSGGVIESTGASGAALHLSEDQDTAITNAGTLRSTSTGNGLLLDTEGQTRDFTNSGTISSVSGSAILAQTAMTGDTNGFVNSGTIDGSGGGTAIDARDAFRLTNSNIINGNITHTNTGALTVTQTGGSITGNITSTVDASHNLTLNGGTITGDTTLNGVTANTFTLGGATVTGNVDLGDGGAHAINLNSGSISGTLDIGTGTTALPINVAGGNTVSIGTLATNSGTTTTINGTGNVNITTFTANGDVNHSAGTLAATTLSVGSGASFTQSGSSLLNAPVTLNGTATLNLNGTTARVTGAITGGIDTTVFVNGNFTSENTINVGHFEIASGGVFNMDHDVTVTSPTTFANLGRLIIDAGNTLTVTGNFTQGATGILQTDTANDTSFGKLVVTGTATLPSNARIDVNVANANFNFTTSGLQDIISAGTLVSDGTFNVTDNSILFDFEALVSGNTVDLCLAAAGESCNSGGGGSGGGGSSGSGGGGSSSGGSESSGGGSGGGGSGASSGGSSSTGVHNAVVANNNQPAIGAAIVFDNLIDSFINDGTSGNNGLDSAIGVLGTFATQREVSDAVSQTLPLFTASAALPIKNTLSTTRRIIQSRLHEHSWAPSAYRSPTDKHFWVTGLYVHHDHGDRKDVTGFNGDAGGLVIGGDRPVGTQTHLGVALAYSETDIENNTNLHSADIKTYHLAGYGRHALGTMTEATFQVGFGLSETNGKRALRIFEGSPIARSSYASTDFHAGGEIGHKIELNGAVHFVPTMRVDYTYLRNDDYTETGANALNLLAESNTLEALELGIGGRVHFRVGKKARLIIGYDVAHDVINEQPTLTSRFAGGGNSFETRGIDPSPWTGHFDVSVPIQLSNNARLSFRYDIDVRDNQELQAASVQLSWRH